MEWLEIYGAREHNLQNVDVRIPKNRLTVVTGVSGSGKSSLAFHTIHAEGQRRYVESLSAYARQFLGGINKPDVQEIRGLTPAIAIDQKSVSHNPRSTVGTVTEIADYARLLWARVGIPSCPVCNKIIQGQSIEQMVSQTVETLSKGTKFSVVSPIVHDRKGEFREIFSRLLKAGFSRVIVDGDLRGLDENIVLEKQDRHSIQLVVDRLVLKPDMGSRFRESLETALEWGDGIVNIQTEEGYYQMSRMWSCPEHGIGVPEMEPRTFSFNAPVGACQTCHGLGYLMQGDPGLLIKDVKGPLIKAIVLSTGLSPRSWMAYAKVVIEEAGVSPHKPWKDISDQERKLILEGSRKQIKFSWRGVRGRARSRQVKNTGLLGELNRRYEISDSNWVRSQMSEYMSESKCRSCKGKRLKPGVLGVKIDTLSISDWMEKSVDDALWWIEKLQFTGNRSETADPICKEIANRLRFLTDVGVGYLTLMRRSGSLSGGESQRLRLASSIGLSLSGCTYVLDEPSIGLAPADNLKLISTLQKLRDIGNTVIVVEHDGETQLAADWLVDVGPGPGRHGGLIVASDRPGKIAKNRKSLTGDYLSGRKVIALVQPLETPNQSFSILKASGNNLQSVSAQLPVGHLIGVTGVSGSGKSTLINDTLVPALQRNLGLQRKMPLSHEKIEGLESFDKVIEINQKPIGRSPKSNPATYTKIFDLIRELYTQTTYAKAQGWKPGRFSFNVSGGRCENCKGGGIIVQEMHFMADVEIECEVCLGKRYNTETLQATWKGKDIAAVLEMSVEEALEVFANQPRIRRRLETLNEVGLGYIRLGESSLHLSGGESQRVKAAAELQKVATGRTLYFLDEPSVGLHAHDIASFIGVLERLRDAGNTVIVVEHSLEIISRCDTILDLGEGGGVNGGRVMGQGTVLDIAQMDTPTGRELLKYVQRIHKFMSANNMPIPPLFADQFLAS